MNTQSLKNKKLNSDTIYDDLQRLANFWQTVLDGDVPESLFGIEAPQVTAPKATVPPSVVRASSPAQDVIPAAEAAKMLTLGQGSPSSSVSQPAVHRRSREYVNRSFSVLSEIFKLKAEAAHWAAMYVDSKAARENCDEYHEQKLDLIHRSNKLERINLWPCNNSKFHSGLATADDFLQLADCFYVMAEAISLVDYADQNKISNQHYYETLAILAEAQSAARSMMINIANKSKVLNFSDNDQTEIYIWLKDKVAELNIPSFTYMRFNNVADPLLSDERLDRIIALRNTISTDVLIKHNTPLLKTAVSQHDIQAILNILQTLFKNGIKQNNAIVRDVLLPIASELFIPEVTDQFPILAGELQRENQKSEPLELVKQAQLSDEVHKVASVLKGHSIVIVGGDKAEGQAANIKHAFGLKELYWVETKDNQPTIGNTEDYISKPDVKVVLLLIRWIRHAYSGIKTYCDKHNKLFVRVPAGYNSNQIAIQIMRQISDKLGISDD